VLWRASFQTDPKQEEASITISSVHRSASLWGSQVPALFTDSTQGHQTRKHHSRERTTLAYSGHCEDLRLRLVSILRRATQDSLWHSPLPISRGR